MGKPREKSGKSKSSKKGIRNGGVKDGDPSKEDDKRYRYRGSMINVDGVLEGFYGEDRAVQGQRQRQDDHFVDEKSIGSHEGILQEMSPSRLNMQGKSILGSHGVQDQEEIDFLSGLSSSPDEKFSARKKKSKTKGKKISSNIKDKKSKKFNRKTDLEDYFADEMGALQNLEMVFELMKIKKNKEDRIKMLMELKKAQDEQAVKDADDMRHRGGRGEGNKYLQQGATDGMLDPSKSDHISYMNSDQFEERKGERSAYLDDRDNTSQRDIELSLSNNNDRTPRRIGSARVSVYDNPNEVGESQNKASRTGNNLDELLNSVCNFQSNSRLKSGNVSRSRRGKEETSVKGDYVSENDTLGEDQFYLRKLSELSNKPLKMENSIHQYSQASERGRERTESPIRKDNDDRKNSKNTRKPKIGFKQGKGSVGPPRQRRYVNKNVRYREGDDLSVERLHTDELMNYFQGVVSKSRKDLNKHLQHQTAVKKYEQASN